MIVCGHVHPVRGVAARRRRRTQTCRVQIKLLVEEGGANVWVRDRWGKTAYDEARRVGATAVAEFLQKHMNSRPEQPETISE